MPHVGALGPGDTTRPISSPAEVGERVVPGQGAVLAARLERVAMFADGFEVAVAVDVHDGHRVEEAGAGLRDQGSAVAEEQHGGALTEAVATLGGAADLGGDVAASAADLVPGGELQCLVEERGPAGGGDSGVPRAACRRSTRRARPAARRRPAGRRAGRGPGRARSASTPRRPNTTGAARSARRAIRRCSRRGRGGGLDDVASGSIAEAASRSSGAGRGGLVEQEHALHAAVDRQRAGDCLAGGRRRWRTR